MSGKGGGGLENDLRNWVKKMGIVPDGNASDVIRNLTVKLLDHWVYDYNILFKIGVLCSGERRVVFEHVIREIRPICEVEYIRKILALKRMSQKQHLKQELVEKEEEICMREHDVQLAHQTLEVLNCKMQAVKQRTRDLATKTLILRCKKQELEKEAVRCEGLCQIAKFFHQPTESGPADEQGSCAKHVKTSCENAICDCQAKIRDFHKLYKMKDVDMETLCRNKRNLLEYVHCWMEDIPVLNIWHVLNSVSHLTKELYYQAQSDVQKDSQQLQCLKENVASEMKKFMKSHLELFAAHHNLQHKINQSTNACDSLLDRAVEMLQEKISGSFQETGKVRQWLELQIRDTELGVITEAVQNEIKILKGYSKLSDITVLTLQEEGMKRQIKGIERLKADIRTNYVWLTKSREGQIKTEEKVKQEITTLSQMCAMDKYDLMALDRLLKRLQGAVQQELKEFIAFPLHLLDNITLPLGSVLPSSHQTIKYHHNIIDMDCQLTDVLTALEGIYSAAPHSIALQILEKKLYLNFLRTAYSNGSDLSPSSSVLDLHFTKNLKNAATTTLTEVINAVKKSVEECKVVAMRAEDNYRAWLEHPVQHAVPEYLQIDGKPFHQWQCEYDSLLTTLTDLESEEEAIQMM